MAKVDDLHALITQARADIKLLLDECDAIDSKFQVVSKLNVWHLAVQLAKLILPRRPVKLSVKRGLAFQDLHNLLFGMIMYLEEIVNNPNSPLVNTFLDQLEILVQAPASNRIQIGVVKPKLLTEKIGAVKATLRLDTTTASSEEGKTRIVEEAAEKRIDALIDLFTQLQNHHFTVAYNAVDQKSRSGFLNLLRKKLGSKLINFPHITTKAYQYVMYGVADNQYMSTRTKPKGTLFRFSIELRYPAVLILDCRTYFIIKDTHIRKLNVDKTRLKDPSTNNPVYTMMPANLGRFLSQVFRSQEFYKEFMDKETWDKGVFRFEQSRAPTIGTSIVSVTQEGERPWKLLLRDFNVVNIRITDSLFTESVIVEESFPI